MLQLPIGFFFVGLGKLGLGQQFFFWTNKFCKMLANSQVILQLHSLICAKSHNCVFCRLCNLSPYNSSRCLSFFASLQTSVRNQLLNSNTSESSPQMAEEDRKKCIFCKIADGVEPNDIVYQVRKSNLIDYIFAFKIHQIFRQLTAASIS